MNRRSFFSTLIKGVGVFSILPPAETYSRIWKATREPVGIFEMLATCQTVDNLPLNLESLFWQLKVLKEHRLKTPPVDTIEIWCRPESALLYA